MILDLSCFPSDGKKIRVGSPSGGGNRGTKLQRGRRADHMGSQYDALAVPRPVSMAPTLEGLQLGSKRRQA